MGDWPQWRGPSRNGISGERGLSGAFPASGPRKLWSVQVGQGFSSCAVAGGNVFTVGNVGGQDTIVCLDARDGHVVWQYRYPCAPGDYGGPRATPTVVGGKVYTMSREGVAFCLTAAAGKLVWRTDLARETRAGTPTWGFGGSPLVLTDRVIYNVGAAGVALNRDSGKVMWKSGGDGAGYSTPVLFPISDEKSGVALFVAEGLVALDPSKGQRLWSYPWRTQYDVNAADPIFSNDLVFISSNYGKGCALLRIAGGKATAVWENRNMKNHFNTSVLMGGHLYGNDENTLKCLDLRTGAERWALRGIDKGGLIAADGKLIVLSGRGELILADVNPQRFVQRARAQVLQGTCWTHPALANGTLFCRSQEGTLTALSLRG